MLLVEVEKQTQPGLMDSALCVQVHVIALNLGLKIKIWIIVRFILLQDWDLGLGLR